MFPPEVLTIVLMRIINAKDAAAAEHHFVLRQCPSLIWKQVLDLTKILSDVKSTALNPGVQLLVVQVQVIVDKVDLAQFHNLNGHIEGNWDQHLMDKNE